MKISIFRVTTVEVRKSQLAARTERNGMVLIVIKERKGRNVSAFT